MAGRRGPRQMLGPPKPINDRVALRLAISEKVREQLKAAGLLSGRTGSHYHLR